MCVCGGGEGVCVCVGGDAGFIYNIDTYIHLQLTYIK